MENKIHRKGTLELEEQLLKRIQELEHVHAHLKQNMSKLMISRDVPQKSHRLHGGADRDGGGVTPHSAYKLTEANFLNILESVNQPIHIINIKGCLIYRNRAWEEFYGYSGAESLGKYLFELVIDPEDAQIADDFLKHILKGESLVGEFPVRNKKGERFLAFGSRSPLSDENGKFVGIISASAVIRPQTDPQQLPSQSTVASKISNMATNVKSKMKKVEEHFMKKPMVNSDHISENGRTIHMTLSAKAKESCLYSRSRHFCYHWLHSDEEDEYALEVSSSIPSNVESQSWVNTDTLKEIKLEHLIIRERIGRGSYGSIYHALWNGSDVSLKLISKQEYSNDLMLSFREEACLMKRLRHPNILLFMGTVSSPHCLCIVTEFLCRGSLFQLLHQNTTKLDWGRRFHMAMDIARGMNYLHHCSPPIIHCDLKSSNLFLDKNWTVKIVDFGLCRIKHEAYVITKEGTGTPEWMAPEVIRDEQAYEKSDVYSYGVVLWEITTEKIPWDGLKKLQVMKAVGFMNQRLDIPKNVDPHWASLIERCLCSEPESRPTFQEIIDKLEEMQKKTAI